MSDIFNPSGGSSTAGRGNNFAGPVIATMGDSFMANGVAITATSQSYVNSGPATWARILTGQRVQFPIANQQGVGGTTLSQIAANLPTVLALNPDYVLIDGGTNDLGGGTVASMKSSMTTIINGVLNAGAIPIILPITPRTAAFSAGIAQKWELYNRWLMEMCAGRLDLLTAAGAPSHRRPYCIDIAPFFDYTSTTGAANTGMIEAAGLHPAQGGGLVWGAQVADIINLTTPPSPTYQTSPYDIYDATNNPTGSLMVMGGVNEGMLRGTNGSLFAQLGLTPTGQLAGVGANAYQLLRTAGSSTATCVASKENPRTDGLMTGERQRITLASSTTGASVEGIRMEFIAGTPGINSNFTAGDVVVFECRYQIYSATNFLGVTANLRAVGGGNWTYTDGGAASNGVSGVDSSTYPDLLRPGVLRTPPMTIQSGVTSLYPGLVAQVACNVSPGAIDFVTSDWKVFKVQ